MKIILGETFYNVAELAEMFGLSETTIRTYFNDGRIIGRKIGKSWHAKESAIKTYFNKDKNAR